MTTSNSQYNALRDLLIKHDAVLISHYYVDAEIQRLTEATGGFVGDSLAMAQFGLKSKASTVIVAGVRFMGETAKILSPEKTVLMPTLQATCSLDLGCPPEAFSQFCDQYPDRAVIVYANTSAAVKARADCVVTSSNALKIVNYYADKGNKIVWAPDRFLGHYIQSNTKADMILWQGSCIVHEEYKKRGIEDLKKLYPEAAVLVHPESPADVIALADVVGSTTQLLNASHTLPNPVFIVATDRGIFYKMQQASKDKLFLEAPTAGHGATCQSCGHCPWMAMNTLTQLEFALKSDFSAHEIKVPDDVIEGARRSLHKMLELS